jgi:hypothetical protein
MCEISLNMVDLDTYERYEDFADSLKQENTLHEGIFSPTCRISLTHRSITNLTNASGSDLKLQKVVQSTFRATGLSGEAGVTITWGSDKGAEVSGYVSGSASDDNGNTAQVTVEINDDGSGSADISVKHDEE